MNDTTAPDLLTPLAYTPEPAEIAALDRALTLIDLTDGNAPAEMLKYVGDGFVSAAHPSLIRALLAAYLAPKPAARPRLTAPARRGLTVIACSEMVSSAPTGSDLGAARDWIRKECGA